MKKLLYYPKIIMPVSLIKQSILYNDVISTIVPESFVHRKVLGEAELESKAALDFLEDYGFYEKIIPETSYNIFGKVEKTFFDRCTPDYLEIARSNMQKKYYYQIYKSKMNMNIERFMLENKIAVEDYSESDAIVVEHDTALLYMSIVAYYFAVYEESPMSILTNEKKYQDNIYQDNSSDYNMYAKTIIYDRLLPAPSEDKSIHDIIMFKQKRKDEMNNFISYIDDIAYKIGHANDFLEIKDIVENSKASIEKQDKDIWKLFVEAFKYPLRTTFSFTSTAVLDYCVTGNAEVAILDGVVKVLGQNVCNTIDHAQDKSSPLSYIYSARRDGII